FSGSLFFSVCTPAVNTQIANVPSPQLRGAAWAVAVFVLHLLGDMSAPPVFGSVTETIDRQRAYLYFSLALIPATICCLLATLTARRDSERVAREGEQPPAPPGPGAEGEWHPAPP